MRTSNIFPLMAESALRGYLAPKLLPNARLDLRAMTKGITSANWQDQKPRLKMALDAALPGKLAKDMDVNDVVEVLDQLDDVKEEIAQVVAQGSDPVADPNADPSLDPDADGDAGAPAIQPEMAGGEEDGGGDDNMAKVQAFLAGKLSDEDIQALMALLNPVDEPQDDPAAVDEELDEEGKPKVKAKDGFVPGKKPLPGVTAKPKAGPILEPTVSKTAMDAAIRAASVAAETRTIARLRSIAEAEKLVRPHIGELAIAQDSAEAVFKLALDAAGVDLKGVPPAAYSAMVKMLPKPGGTQARHTVVAMDASEDGDFKKRFPGATALKLR